MDRIEDDYDPTLIGEHCARFVLVSGCSGGGKSSLVREIGRRGYATIPEAGRQIVKEQHFLGGDALPWRDGRRFAELLLWRSVHQMTCAVTVPGLVFFDRGVIEPAAWLERTEATVPDFMLTAVDRCRYSRRVFLVPPWPEIHAADPERQAGWDAAVAEYEYLLAFLPRHGYQTVIVPKAPVTERADFILEAIAQA